MSRNHLRQEVGGDLSQGPVPELANEPDVPTDLNEFPDAPDESANEQPQDEPALEAFAARIGTDTLGEDSESETDGAGADHPAAPKSRHLPVDTSSRSKLAPALAGLAGFATLAMFRRRRSRRHRIIEALPFID